MRSDRPQPPTTPAEFVARFLAELADLEERRRQDSLARRLVSLPPSRVQPPRRSKG